MTITSCPTCNQSFPDLQTMRRHFNETHRKNPVDFTDQVPDSTIDGSLPLWRCENCRYWGKANNQTVCRLKPGIPAMIQGPAGAAMMICMYPPTLPNEWCGAHVPIKIPTD
jgi:hypothetical protein